MISYAACSNAGTLNGFQRQPVLLGMAAAVVAESEPQEGTAARLSAVCGVGRVAALRNLGSVRHTIAIGVGQMRVGSPRTFIGVAQPVAVGVGVNVVAGVCVGGVVRERVEAVRLLPTVAKAVTVSVRL